MSQETQPKSQPEPQLTILDELKYAYDGLIACLHANDILRVTLFAGLLVKTVSTLQVKACQHLVGQLPSKAILPGLHEEVTVFAGMEGTIDV